MTLYPSHLWRGPSMALPLSDPSRTNRRARFEFINELRNRIPLDYRYRYIPGQACVSRDSRPSTRQPCLEARPSESLSDVSETRNQTLTFQTLCKWPTHPQTCDRVMIDETSFHRDEVDKRQQRSTRRPTKKAIDETQFPKLRPTETTVSAVTLDTF